MIQSNQKQSLLVPYELPKFIRDDPDYANFTLFLQAYYEWMEQNGNTLDASKNLLNYMDVDSTTQQFMQYFLNDFMSYFPQDILADQTKVLKIAKQLYQSKGTPASYQFLFRVLYNTEVDFFYTKDAVLKPSAGDWYVPRSLKLATSDKNFLSINNLRLFGNISKSIATVEAATYDGLKTEVFISNIERLFQSGETVTVVDNRNQPLYFLDGEIVPAGTPFAETLTALIVGQISQVLISPSNRGLSYQTNDPVVVYGGLNPNVAAPIGATVEVGDVTTGSISRINLLNGGYGYALSTPNNMPAAVNTEIIFSNLVGNSPKAPVALVGSIDTNNTSNTTFIPLDVISLKQFHYIGNIAGSSGANTEPVAATGLWTQQAYGFANNLMANANTTLANAFTFCGFSTAPITAVVVETQGGGLSEPPTVQAVTYYNTEDGISQTNLANLGILAPIQIIQSGSGYANNDKIAIIGGSGYGAYANVISVNAQSGGVTSVAYVANASQEMSLGGMGYISGLPVAVVARNANGTITTTTSNPVVTGTGTNFLAQFSNGAPLVTNTNIILGYVQNIINANSMILTSNASANVASNSYYLGTCILNVPAILGTGATFTETLNRIGEITSFNIIDNGEDYVSAPKVSLAVQDLIVSNVAPVSFPTNGDTIYQGENINNASYIAIVDSIISLENFYPSTNSVYQLRVFNYTSKPKVGLPLKIDSRGASINLYPGYTQINNTTFDNSANNSRFDAANGTITYGDGHAQATATFLNGLVIGNGQYLDTVGQPSSRYNVIQSTEYNNFTYEITLSKEIEKYRDVLMNLLHPTGMQAIGRVALTSSNNLTYATQDILNQSHSLDYLIGDNNGSASIPPGTSTNPSNNIVTLQTYGIAANTIFTPNVNTLVFNYGPGPADYVDSLIVAVDGTTITLQDNVWTYFANVAVGSAIANTANGGLVDNTIININYLTGAYDMVVFGNYSNTMYPLVDVIRVNDLLTVNGVTTVVTAVNGPAGEVIVNPALTSGANGLITISRGLTSTYENVIVYGPVGQQYFPEVILDDGTILTTEDGTIILLG